MHHRIAITALAAAVLISGACTDREGGARVPTEPGSAAVALQVVTTRSAGIVNPRTHQLELVTTAPAGVSASVVGTVVTQNAFQVDAAEPGVAPSAGHTSWTFIDDAKHVQKIVLLYRTGGGPPAAMQHFIDGALVSTTAYAWLRTGTGWLRTRSYMQSVRNGTLVGTYTILATIPKAGPGPAQPVRLDHPPAAGPAQRALGTFAYALAFAFAPQDATAQGFYFYACRQEWLKYGAAAALLAGAAVALGAAPEIAPATLTAFIASLATAAAMEDVLIDCMIAHDSVASGGFGGGGFGGAGGSSGSGGDKDCLEGSYAAHCTTAFTL